MSLIQLAPKKRDQEALSVIIRIVYPGFLTPYQCQVLVSDHHARQRRCKPPFSSIPLITRATLYRCITPTALRSSSYLPQGYTCGSQQYSSDCSDSSGLPIPLLDPASLVLNFGPSLKLAYRAFRYRDDCSSAGTKDRSVRVRVYRIPPTSSNITTTCTWLLSEETRGSFWHQGIAYAISLAQTVI